MSTYASGETPQVGDTVLCVIDANDFARSGVEYIVDRAFDDSILIASKNGVLITNVAYNSKRFKLLYRKGKDVIESLDDAIAEKLNQPPLKLHLGCFHKKIYGFTNVDIRPDVNPDLVDDCAKLEKIQNESVDLIYTSHMLEHFSREDGRKALQRWYEVLKFGGKLMVAVPDFEKMAGHYMFYKDLKWLSHMLNGSQKHPYDMHLMSYDEKLLTETLEEVGFKDIKRYDQDKTEFFYIDDYSHCYYPERHIPNDRTTPKPVLMSLNLEATK